MILNYKGIIFVIWLSLSGGLENVRAFTDSSDKKMSQESSRGLVACLLGGRM